MCRYVCNFLHKSVSYKICERFVFMIYFYTTKREVKNKFLFGDYVLFYIPQELLLS